MEHSQMRNFFGPMNKLTWPGPPGGQTASVTLPSAPGGLTLFQIREPADSFLFLSKMRQQDPRGGDDRALNWKPGELGSLPFLT